MSQKTRIWIVGCGGIGGVFAAHLAHHPDVELTVVSRNPDIAEAIQTSGLKVGGVEQPRVVQLNVTTAVPEGEVDFVLLATQPPAVEDAARSVRQRLSPTGAVVVLQNGLCEERVAEIVGSDHVLGGIVTFGASTSGPGEVMRTSDGGVVLGGISGEADSRLDHLSQLLSTIGPVTITENLIGARFSKLALNCAVSTLGTVAGTTLGTLLGKTEARNLALGIMRETVAVAQAEGIGLEPVVGPLRLGWLANPDTAMSGPSHWAKHLLLLLVGLKYRRLRSSMLRAIERGRPPAIDFLNGEVIARGSRLGVVTPLNAAVTGMVRDIAAGTIQPSLSNLEPLTARLTIAGPA